MEEHIFFQIVLLKIHIGNVEPTRTGVIWLMYEGSIFRKYRPKDQWACKKYNDIM